jgi:hypothetical protein
MGCSFIFYNYSGFAEGLAGCSFIFYNYSGFAERLAVGFVWTSQMLFGNQVEWLRRPLDGGYVCIGDDSKMDSVISYILNRKKTRGHCLQFYGSSPRKPIWSMFAAVHHFLTVR